MMNNPQKSDDGIVAMNSANASVEACAELRERRPSAEGNAERPNTHRTQSRASVSQGLDRVRERAKAQAKEKFTALLHHVDVSRLGNAYLAIKQDAAPGIDGITWQQYGEHIEANLKQLHKDIHSGAYRALPSKRQYIPKPDGQKRPLGMAALEDKIVQRAVVEVLNAIYEQDFLGFSYGFRPKRSQHDALDALAYGITHQRVNFIVDADIKRFFDSMSHDWLIELMKHRIGDERILRLIRKWLKAGVMEEGQLISSEEGTPQGAVISPLLANIYLHYVFDLWAEQWRRRHAQGDMIIVRYADDLVVGFEHEADAKRFMDELRERLTKFALSLHPDKTRLIEFGRYAASNRAKRGQSKPESFNFLGFTHICGRSKAGHFQLKRTTRRDRLRIKLASLKKELRHCMHESLQSQGKWLRSVLNGYFGYHAVPTNSKRVNAFRYHVINLWWRTLKRRSQKDRTTWQDMMRLAKEFLPLPRIRHPWPDTRFLVKHPRWEPSALIAPARFCAGGGQ